MLIEVVVQDSLESKCTGRSSLTSTFYSVGDSVFVSDLQKVSEASPSIIYLLYFIFLLLNLFSHNYLSRPQERLLCRIPPTQAKTSILQQISLDR